MWKTMDKQMHDFIRELEDLEDLELTEDSSSFRHSNSGESKKIRNKKRKAAEWRCDYCGQANKRKKTFCDHCGGRRSFLYD